MESQNPRLQDSAPSAAGRSFGRFQLEARLGGEGLLETHQARVQGLAGFDRVFALKALVQGALARRPDAADRLLAAARRLSTLKDPRVVPVRDMGLEPGTAFVVTEFIHGLALTVVRDLLTPREVNVAPVEAPPARWPALVALIGLDVAQALAAAHALSPPLLHGALGPGNVMVTLQGAVKVLDFGLRAAVHPPADLAVVPTRRGYLAPELSGGGIAAAPADVYALGALLHELATGRTPGGDVATAGRLQVLPSALTSAIRALCEKQPEKRPNAAKAVELLRAATTGASEALLRSELSTLVRRLQQRAAQAPAAPPEPIMIPILRQSGEMPLQGDDDQISSFDGPDEPTKMMPVSSDGSPEALAAVLAEMRSKARTTPTMPVAAERPTPVVPTAAAAAAARRPTPVVGSSTLAASMSPETSAATTAELPSLVDLPIDPGASLDAPAAAPAEAAPVAKATPAPVAAPAAKAAWAPAPAPAAKAASGPAVTPAAKAASATGGTPPPIATPAAAPATKAASAPGGTPPPIAARAAAPAASPAAASAPPHESLSIDFGASTEMPALGIRGPEVRPAVSGQPKSQVGAPHAELPDMTTAEVAAAFSGVQRKTADAGPESVGAAVEAVLGASERGEFQDFTSESSGEAAPFGSDQSTRAATPSAIDEDTMVGRPLGRRIGLVAAGVVVVGGIVAILAMRSGSHEPPPAPSAAPVAAPSSASGGGQAPALPTPGAASGAGPGAAAPAAGAGSGEGPGAATPAAGAGSGAGPGAAAPAVGAASGSGQAAAPAAGVAPTPGEPAKGEGAEAAEKAAGSAGAVAARPAPAGEGAGLPSEAELVIESEPRGALVWFDGKERGQTPAKVKLPAGARELRLVRLGYRSATIQLGPQTSERASATLEPTVAPPWGKAIVIIECRTRGKFPIVIDGTETGLLCPTARIGLQPGPHEIGVLVPATGEILKQSVDLKSGVKRLRFKQ